MLAICSLSLDTDRLNVFDDCVGMLLDLQSLLRTLM